MDRCHKSYYGDIYTSPLCNSYLQSRCTYTGQSGQRVSILNCIAPHLGRGLHSTQSKMQGLIICLLICFCSVQGYYNQMQASAGRQYMSNNFMNNRYSNFNNNNNNGHQQQRTTRSNMGYLPFLFGDEGREMATYSMMMNSNGNSMMLPYLMNGGETSSMLPMMAFMNRGGQRMNPFVMSMMMGHEL